MTDNTVAQKSFLGVPIRGEINEGDKREKQRPMEDLAPMFQAVLDDPLIKEFGWRQYTPYFNDGDPCIFSTGSPWFRTIHDHDDDPYDLEVDYGKHPTLGGIETIWEGQYPNRRRVEEKYEGEYPETMARCRALNAAIGGGEFYDVLLDNFGDHARITVNREGIEVETYEHD